MAGSLSASATDVLAPACSGGDTGNSAVCTGANPTSNPVISTLKKVTYIVAYVTGAAAVIMILVGSIQYVISNGDSNRVNNAKNTIIYSLVGVAVVAASASIIEFVLNKI